VHRLIEARSPFRRASRNAIASLSGHPSWLVYDHPMLPNSIKLLKQLAESSEKYAFRKIEDVALRARHPLKVWQLRVAAGVSPQLAHKTSVAQLLSKISRRLRRPRK
jgi:hypothetical protein